MEEVDNIIIDSLRNLNCEIDEDVNSLKNFTPDMVVNAIGCCLEAIIPDLSLPKRMPASMSLRLKLSSQLVEHVQNVGFRGDLGYQTILYSNEVEIRRVLMYLIEHVPRESTKEITTEATGYVPRLVKGIEERIKFALQQPWIPSSILYNGARISDQIYFQQSYGKSVPLCTENIQIPDTKNSTEELKQYWVHNLPEITKQCNPNNLIPSLLFKDNEFSEFKLKEYMKSKFINNENENLLPMDKVREIAVTASNNFDVKQTEDDEIESKIVKVLADIEASKETYLDLQKEYKNCEVKLTQLSNTKIIEEEELKNAVSKLNIKSKTITVLSKEENMEKLKTLVDNGNERLLDLANQWNEVQSPLIEQYRTLQSSVSEHEMKIQEEKDQLLSLKNKISQMENEIVDKDQFEKSLRKELEKLNRHSNRSSYTRRILEIIGNIKKQNSDINKILIDTRKVQKEIKQLTGQLDRSFTMADALIFKDAKYDDVARKAYKLLATLHLDCESIIQSVTDVGTIERESRNLQDQIDAEVDKNMASKLDQILSDIEELKKETMPKK